MSGAAFEKETDLCAAFNQIAADYAKWAAPKSATQRGLFAAEPSR